MTRKDRGQEKRGISRLFGETNKPNSTMHNVYSVYQRISAIKTADIRTINDIKTSFIAAVYGR
jgi:hypothetical protein